MGIDAENIRLWQGHPVIDPADRKIGSLEAVYVDTATDEPAFASVTCGLIGKRRLVFVPLTGAVVGPAYLRVTVDRDLARDAPSIETDGELAATDEPAVFEHYGLPTAPPGAPRRLARR